MYRKTHLQLFVCLLSLLAFALTGPTCSTGLTVVSPPEGASVTTASFVIEVGIDSAHLDGNTLVADLNGMPVALVGGPATYTANIDPGPPLLDQNTLTVRVGYTNGSDNFVQVQRSFDYAPPKARAKQISNLGELIAGPLAHNQIGDYLLENDVARFAIQDVLKRDLHSVGQFGGNLIDAELVGRPGRDQFFEVQPSINVETVINADEIEILNDGQDGTAAVIRTCGFDDLIDYINASSQVGELGVILPPGVDDMDYEVHACTYYRLEPGKRYVEMETEVENLTGSLQSFYVGDYVNGMGTLEQWTGTSAGSIGVGEALVTGGTRFLSYYGFRGAEGVDYSLVPVSLPGEGPSSSFTTVGVTFLMHSNSIAFVLFLGSAPVFDVPPNGTNSFVRYFGVGDGNAANANEIAGEVQGLTTGEISGCITVDGSPAESARVVVASTSASAISRLVAHFVTDVTGCYSGVVVAGSYSVAAAAEGVPYEGLGMTPTLHPVSIDEFTPAVVDIDLPPPGTLSVSVVDENNTAVPARVTVVGFDPSPEIDLTQGLIAVSVDTNVFVDQTRDPLPHGVARAEYIDTSGSVSFPMEPGDYRVVVSRGSEYSAYEQDVTVSAGSVTSVSATIARVVDTPGFISSDYHVHFMNSPDSRVSFADRAVQFAGEGVDNIVATEHDAHSDITPTISSLGLSSWVHATIGEEITTFDTGHFNSYPRAVDPTRPSGGSTDWGGAAPPGQDFPSFGNYILTPAEVEAAAMNDPLNPPGDVVVQINHFDSHFGPLKIDTALTPEPASLLTAAEAAGFRLPPPGSLPAGTTYFHHFPALEVWNGMDAGHQDEFLIQRIGVWMNHLNLGLHSTGIADTDTHGFMNLRSAGARSWTPSTSDAPASVDDQQIASAVRNGQLVGGQGIYVKTRLLTTAGPAAEANFELGGSTLVTATSGEVDLEISVQAPLWAEYDAIDVYVNAVTNVTATNGGVPVEYDATPTLTLIRDDPMPAQSFTRTIATPHPGLTPVTLGQRYETTRTVTLSGLDDSWVVVVVRGVDGVSLPMFPVMPFSLDTAGGNNDTLPELLDGNLGEDGTLALGFTNPLYLDVDGNGQFDPN